MPQLHRYRIFVSHAWNYSSEYQRLVHLLDNARYFIYSNYSVTRQDPLHCRQSELREQLRQQIRPVEVAIVLSGMYVPYSNWIQFEMDFATSAMKPILGVLPWGSQRCPMAVTTCADEIVGWNTDSIVGAIRRLA